jgi:hypothetical protein
MLEAGRRETAGGNGSGWRHGRGQVTGRRRWNRHAGPTCQRSGVREGGLRRRRNSEEKAYSKKYTKGMHVDQIGRRRRWWPAREVGRLGQIPRGIQLRV